VILSGRNHGLGDGCREGGEGGESSRILQVVEVHAAASRV